MTLPLYFSGSYDPHSREYIDVIDQDPDYDYNDISINQMDENTTQISEGSSMSLHTEADSEFDPERIETDKKVPTSEKGTSMSLHQSVDSEFVPETSEIQEKAMSLHQDSDSELDSEETETDESDSEGKRIDINTKTKWGTIPGEASSISLRPASRETEKLPSSSTAFQMTDARVPRQHYSDGFNPLYPKVETPRDENAPDNLDTFVSSAKTRIKPFRAMLKN